MLSTGTSTRSERKVLKTVAWKDVSHCDIPPVSTKRPKRRRACWPRIPVSREPLLFTPEYEKRINEIMYANKVFFDYHLKPLDGELEVRIWETIVKRCNEFPDLLYMIADFNLRLSKNTESRQDSRIMEMKFKHQEKKRQVFRRYFWNERTSSESIKPIEEQMRRSKVYSEFSEMISNAKDRSASLSLEEKDRIYGLDSKWKRWWK